MNGAPGQITAPPVRGDMVVFRQPWKRDPGRTGRGIVGVILDLGFRPKRAGRKRELLFTIEITDPLSNQRGRRIVPWSRVIEYWTPDREAST